MYKKPLISVVTVCYQAGGTIEETIKSVLGQTYERLEYIIKDGGSTDRSASIVDSYREVFAQRGAGFFYVSGMDAGVYDAMNQAVSYCRGEFILFLNADDAFYAKDSLERFFRHGEIGEQVKILYGNADFKDGRYHYLWEGDMGRIESCCPFCHQAALISREWLTGHPFDAGLRIAADYNFFLEAFRAGAGFKKVDEIIVTFRRGGLSCTDLTADRRERREIILRHREGSPLPQGNALREEAGYRLGLARAFAVQRIFRLLPEGLGSRLRHAANGNRRKLLAVEEAGEQSWIKKRLEWELRMALWRLTGRKRTFRAYNGKPIMDASGVNQALISYIQEGKPFMAGRLGRVELEAMASYEPKNRFLRRRRRCRRRLCNNAGFFAGDKGDYARFAKIMREACKEADLIAVWFNYMEDYILGKYCRESVAYGCLEGLEPWYSPKEPWSALLEGKRVLFIHPAESTILKQAGVKGQIFPGTSILPDFELYTLKAVQTISDNKDDRFPTWFDALDYMYEEAMKIPFDLAIIGCGAYGFPLAARLKKAGRSVIHLGGQPAVLGNQGQAVGCPSLHFPVF